MKTIKLYFAVLLCLTLPVWGASAAVPELPAILVEIPGLDKAESSDRGAQWSSFMHRYHEETAAINAQLIEFLFPPDISSLGKMLNLETLSDEDLEAFLQSQLIFGEDKPFWTHSRKIIASVVLLTALLSGLLVLFAAGSGSGSGSGSGGGGNHNNQGLAPGGGGSGEGSGGGEENTGGGDDIENLFDPQGGGGGEEGGSGGGNPFPEGIPENPEPGTFLMFGLGMLLPFLRRKK